MDDDVRPGWRASWRGCLHWRFGPGAARVLPRGATMPETGVLGNGTSVAAVSLPDETALESFGFVDRLLRRLPDPLFVEALSLAYGDAGSVVTNGGLWGHLRWRAVAPLTRLARERGAAWVLHHPGHGAPPVRWCQRLFEPGSQSEAQRSDRLVLETQATNLLTAAETAFAEVHHVATEDI